MFVHSFLSLKRGRKGEAGCLCSVGIGSESLLWTCSQITQCDFKKIKVVDHCREHIRTKLFEKSSCLFSPLIVVMSWEIHLSLCIFSSIGFEPFSLMLVNRLLRKQGCQSKTS